MFHSRRLMLALLLWVPTGAAVGAERDAKLFDAVWDSVRESFYDPNLHGVDWDGMRDVYRPLVLEAPTDEQVRALLLEMLAELDASHVTILDGPVYRSMMRELWNRPTRTLGILLEESMAGRIFVRAMYEGGPCELAGMRMGDRIIEIDGVPVFDSPVLVDAGYDPALPGPRLFFLDSAPDRIELLMQRTPDAASRFSTALAPAQMNAVDAASNSVRIVERDGMKIGTLHVWFCSRGVAGVLEDAVRGPLADCDALVLDVRGRGGFSDVVVALLDVFRGESGFLSRMRGTRAKPLWTKPLVVLTDDRSRSAKELFAYRIRHSKLGKLVGQRTEGAVLGAMFHPLPDGSYLELAGVSVPIDGVSLEGNGVRPHHEVDFVVPYADGHDSIFEKGCEVAADAARRATTGVKGPF